MAYGPSPSHIADEWTAEMKLGEVENSVSENELESECDVQTLEVEHDLTEITHE